MGHELSVTLSTGPLKSANSVRNINTAKSLQKNRKQFDSNFGAGSCLNYTSILLHLK